MRNSVIIVMCLCAIITSNNGAVALETTAPAEGKNVETIEKELIEVIVERLNMAWRGIHKLVDTSEPRDLQVENLIKPKAKAHYVPPMYQPREPQTTLKYENIAQSSQSAQQPTLIDTTESLITYFNGNLNPDYTEDVLSIVNASTLNNDIETSNFTGRRNMIDSSEETVSNFVTNMSLTKEVDGDWLGLPDVALRNVTLDEGSGQDLESQVIQENELQSVLSLESNTEIVIRGDVAFSEEELSEFVSSNSTVVDSEYYSNRTTPAPIDDVIYSSEISVTDEEEPHCGELCNRNCLRFNKIEANLNYEVRQYDKTVWASTIIVSKNRVLASLEGLNILQEYYRGYNDPGTVMNSTFPIVSQIRFPDHPGVGKQLHDLTVSIPLAETYGEEVPRPLSNEILIDTTDVRMVFSQSFRAWVWEVTDALLQTKADNLKTELRRRGEAFHDRYYYLACYEGPITQNSQDKILYEIWIYGPPFRDLTKIRLPVVMKENQKSKSTSKTKQKLCRGLECPNFDVLRVFKYGIQKRRYYDSVFATTNPDDCFFNSMAVWRGMIPLHLYKHGMNSHFEVLEGTKPIGLIHVVKGHEQHQCPENLTVGIYLPSRLHSNPPLGGPPGTALASVTIRRLDDLIVYVWPVGGYLLDPTRVHSELEQFAARLKQFHLCFRDDQYYVVVYDFIVRFHGRQNEIWVLAENCKAESYIPSSFWSLNKKLVPPEEFLTANEN